MSILSVSNLSHSYNSGKNWVVNSLNFQIEDCGVVALLGSNGAGKSTTMNIICGVLNQTKGKVLINGYDIQSDPIKAKSELGFLPQTPPLYLDLTVSEYLIHCARLRHITESDIPESVQKVMDKVSISHFKNRLLKNLSGGYRQRVGIAQAIIHSPKLVIFDEPTVGLDPNQIIEIRKLIREISKNCAVLISTHILSEVQQICQDVIMINSGSMVFSGSMIEFRDLLKPTAVLAKFGTPPNPEELQSIHELERWEYKEDASMRLIFKEGFMDTDIIIKKSVENNWDLKEINVEQIPMDDIFSKLSRHN